MGREHQLLGISIYFPLVGSLSLGRTSCLALPSRYEQFDSDLLNSGLGNGLVLSTAFVALTAKVEEEHLPMACSIYYLTQQVGTPVGIAITDAVLQNVLWRGLQEGSLAILTRMQ